LKTLVVQAGNIVDVMGVFKFTERYDHRLRSHEFKGSVLKESPTFANREW